VDLGTDNEKLGITIVDPDGNVSHKPRFPLEGLGSSYDFHVDAGTTATWSLALTEWFKLDKVGDYQVDVALAPDSAPQERFSYRLVGGRAKLNLTVRPRDEGALRLACYELLSRVQRLPYGSPEKWSAAGALSNVDDPVAVPYLIEALSNRDFEPMVIPALARLKTDEAIAALVAASQSSDKETRGLARSALANLRKR
jgi:hypothetical protein